MKTCKSAILAAHEVLYNTVLWLSLAQVVTAFVEADMWLFTEPSQTSFSLLGALTFIASLWLTPNLVFCSRIRAFTPRGSVKFVLTILEPSVLFVVSLPILNGGARIRTMILACGVAASPLVAMWLLCNSSCSSLKFRKCNLDVRNKLKLFCKRRFHACKQNGSTKHEGAKETNSGQRCDVLESKSAASLEMLLSIVVTMTIRWHYGSVNVFYETWQAPAVVLILTAALAMPVYLYEVCACDAPGLVSYTLRNGNGSTDQRSLNSFDSCFSNDNDPYKLHENCETGLNETVHTVVDGNSIERLRRDSVVEQLPDGHCKVTLQESGNRAKTTTGPPTLDVENLTTGQNRVLWLCALADGLGKGALFGIAMWLFSSPAVLCRWSGKSPHNFGAFILLSFFGGTAFVAMLSWIAPQQNKRAKFVHNLVVSMLSVLLMFTGASLLLRGADDNISFDGACILSAVIPCALHASFELTASIESAAKVISPKACHCSPLSALGLTAIVASATFTITTTALIMFINPSLSTLLLGQMNVILYGEVFLISLTFVGLSTVQMSSPLPKSIPSAPPSWFGAKISKIISLNQKSVIATGVALIVLLVYIPIGPQYNSQYCVGRYSQQLQNLQSSFKYRSKEKTEITFMSWNILLGHDMDGKGNLPCVSSAINVVKPDVVALQESDALPSYWGGKDALGYLAHATDYRAYHGVPPLKSSLGVGLLTNFKVVEHRVSILPSSPSVKVPHYSLTETVINISSTVVSNETHPEQQLIHVFNVHAVYKNWTGMGARNISQMQMNEIAKRIQIVPTRQPLVLLGDFNLNPFEKELDVFYELGLKSALHPARKDFHRSSLLNRHAFVDHIFFRGLELVKSELLEETGRMSDHLPILARFRRST